MESLTQYRHKFEQALGDGEGQEGLACCSPWGRKELDTTELLNNNNLEPGMSASSISYSPPSLEQVSDFTQEVPEVVNQHYP